jgi:hypothetical protein
MRNLERLIKKLETKTSGMFEAEKPFCIHRKPAISYPDGSIEGDSERCKICENPQLMISIRYSNCEREKMQLLSEAKHFLAESETDSDFQVLERKEIIDIVCREFEVAREDLLVDALPRETVESSL